MENRLHIASREEEACFVELKGYIAALEKYDSTLVNLANIMLIPYVRLMLLVFIRTIKTFQV